MNKKFPDPPAHLHCIGIKGQAMTALAQILQGYGYTITGSDVAEVFPTDAVLKRLGIPWSDAFSAENISSDVATVIYSTAYQPDHVERRRASDLGIPEWSYPEVAKILFATHRQSIAIAGSHGKTTTTALLGHILETGGFDPTVIVGSVDKGWASNARVGHSEWFILEADEYQNKFQYYSPCYLMITNVDYDHPDFFPDRHAYEDTFLDFVSKVPTDGLLMLWNEDPLTLVLRSKTKTTVQTYGYTPESDWCMSDVVVGNQSTAFRVHHKGLLFGQYRIPFAGVHYALNATGAIALASAVGVKPEAIESAITHFRGTSRRMERRGEYHGCPVIDDFAHHPTEITATLQALRAEYPDRRLVAVFHPHTFSRTEVLMNDFVTALSGADLVYILPIYSSGREGLGKVTSDDVVKKINVQRKDSAQSVPSIGATVALLRSVLGNNDVLVTMGAGDVWRVAEGLTA